MKTISQTYKDNIKQLGKEITYEITYDNTTLGDEDILNANLHYDGGILKSVMKQLDIELYNDLPIGTELTYKFGVKVDDTNYEKINYGKFIVYSSEKLEDSNTYKLVCYDKMLYAMKDYEAFATFPITIRDYINALCNHLELTFANTNDDFTNYDKTIQNELYLDSDGNSLNYTFRDVLDEIAQATASTICVENDELVLKDITNTNEEKASVSGTSLSMTAHDNNVDIDLLGNTTQNTTTGKNLLPNDLATKTINGITITKNNDGTYKVNGTATSDVSEAVCNNFISMSGTWRMLGCPSGGSSSTYMLSAYVGYWGAGSPNIDTGSGTNITYTGNVKVRFYIKSGTTCNNLIFKPMLTTDTSTTIDNWERYTYGASPNPNYPQNVETTTGRNTIDVSEINIWDEQWELGAYNWSNGQPATSTTSIRSKNKMLIKPNTEYYVKITSEIVIEFFDENNVFLGSSTNVNKLTSGTFTTPSNAKYFHLYLTSAYGTTYKNDICINVSNTSINGTYKPYIGNSYEVNLGKNLLSEIENGGIDSSGNLYNSTTVIRSKNYDEIQPNTTYTISMNGSATSVNVAQYDSSKIFINLTFYNGTFTTSATAKYVKITKTATLTDLFQLEKGDVASSYSSYFEPIELCKIGNYQDRLFKASGKNLYNPTNLDFVIGNGRYSKYGNGVISIMPTGGDFFSSTPPMNANPTQEQKDTVANYGLLVEPNTQYTFSYDNPNTCSTQILVFQYDEDYKYINVKNSTANTNIKHTYTITTDSNAKYLMVRFDNESYSSSAKQLNVQNIMLEKSSTATDYEPYGNYWYKYKAIGKYTFTGVSPEAWSYKGTTNSRSVFQWSAALPDKLNTSANLPILCNNFSQCTISQTDGYAVDEGIANGIYNGYAIKIITKQASDLATFKTWLANHTTYVYYQLATPTYTKIENEELIGQLEHIRLLNGYNNVISSSPITLNYVSGIDTIDEEYLKDINVNFGEMTKPINTITFKRSGDTDVISLSYPEDLEDDKKNEIAISDNQILNYDNRDEYLKGILDKLYGLTYCLNDYTSTGITYYDLCDRYEVSITRTDVDGNVIETSFYPCIMFNDEINVNQGLQEMVHTDRAEESITDYTTTTKSDRLKTRTDLIVNKQEGFIEAVTGSLQIGEDGQSEVVNGVVSRQTETERTINVITSFDENGNPTGVKTTKGFTFNEDGLNITSSDNTYKTQIDEQGTYYYDGDEILGQTTKEGSKFKNMDLYGEFHYGMDEITDTPLFVSMKFTDGNEECFGHFWNGS